MHLSISSRSAACTWAQPWALTDRDTGQLVGCFKSASDCMKARVLLEATQAGARDLSAVELQQLAESLSEELFSTRDIGKLRIGQFNTLVAAVRDELRQRDRK